MEFTLVAFTSGGRGVGTMAAAKRFDNLVTEQRNQATQDIDTLSTEDMIALINAEDAKAVAAVAEQRKSMAKAV